jgi:hypothetical protein
VVNSYACVNLLMQEIDSFTYVPSRKDTFNDVQFTPSQHSAADAQQDSATSRGLVQIDQQRRT